MANIHISREMYRNIKAMNREELETYLNDLCSTSYNQGVETLAKTVSEKIVAGLQKTKGIGEKRINDILESINRELAAK